MADPYAEYLAATRGDIARLPEHLAGAAKVVDHGEAEWPSSMAEAVVRSLVGLGRCVDVVMTTDPSTGPVATYGGGSAEDNLRWILSSLDLLTTDSAVVCWVPGDRE